MGAQGDVYRVKYTEPFSIERPSDKYVIFKIFKNISGGGDDYGENAAKSEFKNIQKIES